MKVSAEARTALIEAFEGARLLAYVDCSGILTIGYGHTSAAGAPVVRLGMRLSAKDADEVLARDLDRVESGLSGVLRGACLQREFDALVDFAFNVGLGALRSSSLLRAFNRGDKSNAANAFLFWNRSRGRVAPGLTRRRQAERAWFLGLVNDQMRESAPEMAHRVDHPDSHSARIVNRIVQTVQKRRPIVSQL